MPAVFVHVSDIHFGQEKDDRIHIHADVKQQLINDAKDVVSQINGGVAQGILVTGDIAHSGRRAQYEAAGRWLDDLASSIGVEIHCVQMVPGNHDLDRSKLSFSGTQIVNHLRANGPEEFERILSNPTDRAALFAPFEEYGRFSYGYSCPLNSDGAYSSDLTFELAPGRTIRFIRFNSSLLCHGNEGDEHPELIIGARQFTIPRAIGEENIVLAHHPINWYKDQDQVRNYIRSRARMFISGHEHNPKVVIDQVEEGCDLMLLAAGATVPYRSDDTYTFTYNILEFEWDEEKDGLSVKMHPRAWNAERTRFEPDHLRLGGKEPTFRLACPLFRGAQSAPPLSDQQHPKSGQSEVNAPSIGLSADSVNFPKRGDQPMSSKTIGYETARLRFFRDLLEGERLRILFELDALPAGFNERLSQALEGRLFDKLVESGKLGEVESKINELIRERMR